MNNNNAMISQQARSIAASAVVGNSKGTSGKNKNNGNAKFREIHQTEGYDRHYSFAFFIAVLISIVGALCLGFLLGVIGII